MTLSEIIKAVNLGLKVYCRSTDMIVKTDGKQRYWIEYQSEFFGGIQFMPLEQGDGWMTWLNGDESDYFTNND